MSPGAGYKVELPPELEHEIFKWPAHIQGNGPFLNLLLISHLVKNWVEPTLCRHVRISVETHLASFLRPGRELPFVQIYIADNSIDRDFDKCLLLLPNICLNLNHIAIPEFIGLEDDESPYPQNW